VQGPFDDEKVRTLVRRGQLSRLHEISTDGASWNSGASYPELFASGGATTTATASAQTTAVETESPVGAQNNTFVASGSSAVWYYAQGNNELGPVDMETLRSLLLARQIKPDTLVWREGMSQWAQAAQVPGLIQQEAVSVANQGHGEFQYNRGNTSADAQELSITVSRALDGSRGWVMFLASVGIILAALMLIGGLLFVILGARSRLFPVVAQGLFSMVQAVIYAIGAFMLHSFANRIARFSSQRTERTLVHALDSMRTFWGYIGILTIVGLALLLIVVIWALSIGITIPNLSGNDDLMANIRDVARLV
jgi:hypothetical protein